MFENKHHPVDCVWLDILSIFVKKTFRSLNDILFTLCPRIICYQASENESSTPVTLDFMVDRSKRDETNIKESCYFRSN